MPVNRVPLLYTFFFTYYAAQGFYQSFTAFEQPFLESAGVSLGAVATIQALAQLPWVVKIVFAIPSDKWECRSPWGTSWGYRRPYALVGMLVGGITLAVLAGLNPRNAEAYVLLTLVRNTGVCISDVAVDGMAVDCGLEEQSGVINAVMTAGRMLGLIIGSQIGGVLAERYGFPAMILFLAVCVGAVTWVPLMLKEERQSGVHSFEWKAFREFVRPRVALFMASACASNMGLAVAAFPLAKWARETHGFSLTDVGTASMIASIGLLLGSILNGRLFDKVNKRLAMVLAGGASSVTLLAYTWTFNKQSVFVARMAAGCAEGALWIVQAGMTMRLADKRTGASFFALAIMMMNLAIMLGNAIAGPLAERYGLEACFYMGGFVSFAQLLPVPWIDASVARPAAIKTAVAPEPVGSPTSTPSSPSSPPTESEKQELTLAHSAKEIDTTDLTISMELELARHAGGVAGSLHAHPDTGDTWDSDPSAWAPTPVGSSAVRHRNSISELRLRREPSVHVAGGASLSESAIAVPDVAIVIANQDDTGIAGSASEWR